MMNKDANPTLLGSNIIADVSEPWDFVASSGDNKLEGAITDVQNFAESDLITIKISPFVFDDNSISILYCRPRHFLEESAAQILTSGKWLTCNMHFSRETIGPQAANQARSDKPSLGLIGSLRLATFGPLLEAGKT